MKIASFPYRSQDFYLKPDTALAKPQDDFFIPPFCSAMAYAVCYVVKINRLGRWIEERYAARYVGEWNIGVCLYGVPADVHSYETGLDVAAYPQRLRLLDYSLPMPRTFYADPLAAQQALDLTHLSGTAQPIVFPTAAETAAKLSALSKVIYVKMGDLMLIELHPPVAIEKGNTLYLPPLFSIEMR